jgi:hypothetical protein
LFRSQWARPRIGEINRAVGFNDNVVWPIQAASLEAVGNHCDAAVVLLASDAAGFVFAGQQPALQVAGEAIGLVGVLLEYGDALAGRVFHAFAGVDVAEQQIAALLPPQRPFGRTKRTSEVVANVATGLY